MMVDLSLRERGRVLAGGWAGWKTWKTTYLTSALTAERGGRFTVVIKALT